MTNLPYDQLKRQYQLLLKENEALKERIREFEAKAGKLPLQDISIKLDRSLPSADSQFRSNVRLENRSIDNSASKDEKIVLFMSLFRGRNDVYARKWQSKKGKSGYSPVCQNLWQPGICKKPKIKCHNCSHKSYVPLTSAVIENHLRGEIVVGVYPLLTDETCYFLAMDFDNEGWQNDISAVRDVCVKFDIPVTVERSQSGSGCHAWFFFKHPLSASLARRFGTALLTYVMGEHHQLSFSSYDRLFPNQDTMPKGGFGNLIALPLQKKAREHGDSVFVNDDFTPWPDQWAFLSTVPLLEEKELEGWIAKLVQGRDLGEFRVGDEEKAEPWKKAPAKLTATDFSQIVKIVRSAMLYVTKKGFSQQALNAVKRCAAFKNPQFYKTQVMRQSTFGIPRVISCCDDHGSHLALPRGCERDLCKLLEEYGVTVQWGEDREPGRTIAVQFKGKLREEQQRAVDTLLEHENGVLSATTAFGKTVVGAGLIAARKVNTLILVHRQQLVTQWRERLDQFLVIDEVLPELPQKRGRKRKREIIGHLAGGKERLSSIVDVAVMQSLNRGGEIRECVKNYGMIIVDECHHVPAFTFEQILKEAGAKFIYGLTATPARPDGHHPIIFFYCGPVRHSVDPKTEAEKRPFDHCLIPRFTSFRAAPHEDGKELTLHEVKDRLVFDQIRNQLIADDVIRCFENGRTCLVLTGRKAHVNELVKALEKKSGRMFCLTGGLGAKEIAGVMKELKSIPAGEPFILVSTGSYIGEGFDDHRLDTLFLAMPISWKGTLQQYVGRLHRLSENKKEVQVYDYVDLHVRMLERMYGKRLKGYAAIGYKAKVENFPDAPTNIIFTKVNFFPFYLRDISNASRQVVIVSPFVTKKRVMQMMVHLREIMEKQVQVTIVTRPVEDFSAEKTALLNEIFSMVKSEGIQLVLKSNIHQKFAIIDDHITWYGSINLLSFGYSEESVMRLQSTSIVYELMDILA